jgi:hypothetical protein
MYITPPSNVIVYNIQDIFIKDSGVFINNDSIAGNKIILAVIIRRLPVYLISLSSSYFSFSSFEEVLYPPIKNDNLKILILNPNNTKNVPHQKFASHINIILSKYLILVYVIKCIITIYTD